MRVVLMPSAFWPAVGGVEELTTRLAKALQQGGDLVEIWAPLDPSLDIPAHEAYEELTVRRFPMPLPPAKLKPVLRAAPIGARSLRHLARAVASFRPDVLHVQCFGPNGAYATALSTLTRVPLVVTLQGETVMDDNDIYGHSSARRTALRLSFRCAAAVTACSAFTLDDACRFGLRRGTGKVVYNGVALDEVPNVLGTVKASGNALTGPPFRRYVLALGRAVQKKGFDLLIRAFAHLSPPPGTGLVIGGDGAALAPLRHLVSELGLSDQVWFPGRLGRGEVAELMKAAELFVMPSRIEPFGIVVLEAWRAGTPVVATSHGGPSEFVDDGVNGLLVDPFDTLALAGAIGGLLQDSERRAKLGQAGREKVTRFAWPAIADEYRDIYDAASQGGEGLRRSAPTFSPPPVDHSPHQANRRYKAVYLDHCAKASGAELALARMLPALEDFDPLVVLAEEGPLVSLLLDRHVAVRVLPMAETSRGIERSSVHPGWEAGRALWGTLHYVGTLVRLLRAERPHVVVTNSLKSALYGGIAANLVGIPVVWHVADRIEPDYLPRPVVKLVRICARVLPSAVIANSAAVLRTLHLEADPKRPRAVEAIAPPCDLPGAGRQPHGSDGDVTIGMVGQLQPSKGQDVFLRAFATAFPDGPVKGVVVGGAPFGEDDFELYLADLAAELGLRDRVRFTGHFNDPVSDMEGFDILVHASVIPEPFGQVVVEGMALGLPVVASDAGGPAEVITDHVDGILYPPGDIAALANALRELSTDIHLRRRLGEAAARRAKAYSPRAIVPQVEAVYKQVLGRHG